MLVRNKGVCTRVRKFESSRKLKRKIWIYVPGMHAAAYGIVCPAFKYFNGVVGGGGGGVGVVLVLVLNSCSRIARNPLI